MLIYNDNNEESSVSYYDYNSFNDHSGNSVVYEDSCDNNYLFTQCSCDHCCVYL